MGFMDDFTDCITGKNLPPDLANSLPDAKTALSFASKLIQGATVVDALVAIGIGTEVAEAIAEAVAAITVGAIIGAVVGCAVNAAGSSLPNILLSMDGSDTSALQGALADAGFNASDSAAA